MDLKDLMLCSTDKVKNKPHYIKKHWEEMYKNIRPFSTTSLCLGCCGSCVSRYVWTSISPATTFASSGEYRGVLNAAERCNISRMSGVCPGVCPGVSSQLDMPEKSHLGGIQKAS